MTQMLETVIRLRVLLQLSINSLAQLSLGLSGPQQDSLSLTLTHIHSAAAHPAVYPLRAAGFLDGERGDSGDVTQQWQEVTSDQYRLARSTRHRSAEPTNIPAEEINM